MVRTGLEKAVDGAPDAPGIYSFIDSSGRILYIGKAKSLRKRLKNHLRDEGDTRHRLLLRKAVTVEWTITANEVEALLLEAELIRLRKPPLNVRLHTSSRYPYLEVTTDEKWPRLIMTRERSNPRHRPRFGPYPDARNLRKLVEFLLDITRLRRCGGREVSSRERPCLMGQMGKCISPCTGSTTRDKYLKRIDELLGILKGDWDGARKRLESAMKKAADSLDFEEAAGIRDLLSRLDSFGWPSPGNLGNAVNRDVAAVLENWGILMRIRGGRFTCTLRIPFDGRWRLADEGERLSVLLKAYYGGTDDVPGEILVPAAIPDADYLEAWLSSKRDGRVSISIPSRGNKSELLELAMRNLREFLLRLEWKHPKRGGKRMEGALDALADIFALPRIPRWIVCLDASNIHGSWPVAAVVSFRDGYPDRNGYRRFSMPDELGKNDPAMIHEAVRRYFETPEEEYPDVFLVDGGITQLKAAVSAAGEFASNTRFISIAKKEEILIDAMTWRETRLPLDSTPLSFLRMVRDEAHRFVLHYHQSKRSRETFGSVLDDIPGIGPATRTRLLLHFGSAEKVAAADLEEIMEVPGVGRVKAEMVVKYFRKGKE